MYPDANVPTHPNGVRFSALSQEGDVIASETYFSIGGGFIVTEQHFSPGRAATPPTDREVPYPFVSAKELLELATENQLTIAELVTANERAMLSDPKIIRPATMCERRCGRAGTLGDSGVVGRDEQLHRSWHCDSRHFAGRT